MLKTDSKRDFGCGIRKAYVLQGLMPTCGRWRGLVLLRNGWHREVRSYISRLRDALKNLRLGGNFTSLTRNYVMIWLLDATYQLSKWASRSAQSIGKWSVSWILRSYGEESVSRRVDIEWTLAMWTSQRDFLMWCNFGPHEFKYVTSLHIPNKIQFSNTLVYARRQDPGTVQLCL